MPAQLLSTSEGQTLVLTLSNPELRNAIEPAMYAAGIEALNVAERSPDVRSVVITGAGGMFCSGGNLQRLQANRQQPPEVQAQSIEGLHQWIETIRTYPKPIIAAVEGAAAGAGFSLALACDMVVAARDAVFLMAYSNVALSPDGGASWLLPTTLASGVTICQPPSGAGFLATAGAAPGSAAVAAGEAAAPSAAAAFAALPPAPARTEVSNRAATSRVVGSAEKWRRVFMSLCAPAPVRSADRSRRPGRRKGRSRC